MSYEKAVGEIRAALGSKNKVDEVKMAHALAKQFREHYERAKEIASGR